jgi:hypothetical protein
MVKLNNALGEDSVAPERFFGAAVAETTMILDCGHQQHFGGG